MRASANSEIIQISGRLFYRITETSTKLVALKQFLVAQINTMSCAHNPLHHDGRLSLLRTEVVESLNQYIDKMVRD